MGYYMSAVLPMNEVTEKCHQQAIEAFNRARAALKALPKEETGEIDIDLASSLSFADHRAWKGRTERYIALADAEETARKELDRTNHNNFQLNGYGMGCVMHAMGLLGMLQHTDERRPYDFPDGDAISDAEWETTFDLKDARLKELACGEADNPQEAEQQVISKAVSDYVDALLCVLLWVPEPVTGVYSEKFSSNDGWAVTPKEIAAALATYRTRTAVQVDRAVGTAGLTPHRDIWDRWIRFLAHTETHGGFTVH